MWRTAWYNKLYSKKGIDMSQSMVRYLWGDQIQHGVVQTLAFGISSVLIQFLMLDPYFKVNISVCS